MKHVGNKKLRDHVLAKGHEFEKCQECLLRLKEKGIKTITTIISLKDPSKDTHENIGDLLSKL